MDLDVTLERTLGVLETKIALAAAEQRHEDVAEVLADLDESLEEEVARGRIDFPDRLLERPLRRSEIVALGGKKTKSFGLFFVLLDGEGIDRPQRVQLLANERRLGAQSLVVELDGFGAGEKLVDGLLPLGL